MTIKTYSFEDGKYQLDRNTDNGLITDARRNGEHWPAGMHGMQFNHMVHAMLNHIDELEALSVTNVLLDVVPGEDHEHEVYADSVNAVVEMLSAMGLRNEDLKGELVTLRAAMKPPALAPWPDAAGNPIYHGDRLRHPADGLEFVAVKLPVGEEPSDMWRAVYVLQGDLITVSRLCLQIGDKGQAVVVRTE